MPTLPSDITEAIGKYHDTYLGYYRSDPQISGTYALFPFESEMEPAHHKWPDPWPNGESPGVYLILGERMKLLYVGKAACLAKRLNEYFRYTKDDNRGCHIVHDTWVERPSFLATVALKRTFEASSLEEYLIHTLHPSENRLWNGYTT